jgi:hypothetical protein
MANMDVPSVGVPLVASADRPLSTDHRAAGHLARPGRFAYLWRMLGFLKEFWAFLSVRKKFWLFPVLIVMALFAALVVLTEGSAVAPFIYTLF